MQERLTFRNMNCCDVKRKKRSKSEMSFKFTIRCIIFGWQITSTGNAIQGMHMKISETLGIYGVPFPPKFNVLFYIVLCTIYPTFCVCHLQLHSRFNVCAFNIQLWVMQHSSFPSRHSTFNKQQSSFLIRLWALYLQVSAFDIQLFELNFYRLVSERWRWWAKLTWLTPAQMVVESRSRDFPVERTR